jgi:hypothetical protein
MKQSLTIISLSTLALCVSCIEMHAEQSEGLVPIKAVRASSERKGNPATNVVDGNHTDGSRWLSEASGRTEWIELELPEKKKLIGLHLHSGYQGTSPIADFIVQFKRGEEWVDIPSANITNNKETSLALQFDNEVDVSTDTLRLWITRTPHNTARISGIVVWSDAIEKVPPVRSHVIAVNQVGFPQGAPKRFTAPLTQDGSAFIVRPAAGGPVKFTGEIRNHIGDFSAIQVPDGEYVIEVSGAEWKDTVSDVFLIQDNLYQQQFWQPAVDFLIDSRSVVGTHPSAFGGCPWRDGTYYDAILPSLVLFYLADPELVESMPKQIDWTAEKMRVLAPNFRYDSRDPGGKGILEVTKAYYEKMEPPAADAPDVVKLMHWGAGFYLVNPSTLDPSKDPDGRKIHSQTVEQVAYIVWAWPALKQWLPESFYRKCLEFCFANWSPSLEISKWWDPSTYLKPEDLVESNPMGGILHPYKGRHAPGHSIVPNLLMHEVALREGREDAAIYLEAAVKQADWCVKNLDWNDPRTTKGHRMSEHRTIPNLVWLLQNYPAHAPAGLREKINAWAEVAISRSENLWDYRRYDMEKHWSIPKLNDVGNLLAFPAIATAASWVVDDSAKKARLKQISTATVDHVFGRNPRLAAAPHKPGFGFSGIERGWPKGYKDDTCARLELVRGSISSAPGTEMFPFNPKGAYRHPEGWVNYGAAWCISLAYLQFDATGMIPAIKP